MTYDEFLDNCNRRYESVYRCKQCSFRGIGADVTYHTLYNPNHETYREPWLRDKPNEKNSTG